MATALLGFVYAVFYGALDVLAGVGAGALALAGQARATEPLLRLGNRLSYVGVAAYLLAAVLACTRQLRVQGWSAVPGSLLVTAASLSFLTSHI